LPAQTPFTRRSAAEPCPTSDAEPPLHRHVFLSILRRTPDKQHANDNERYEQHQEDDHNEGDIHTVVLPEASRFYAGGETTRREGRWLGPAFRNDARAADANGGSIARRRSVARNISSRSLGWASVRGCPLKG
jgi:hypothetical protein